MFVTGKLLPRPKEAAFDPLIKTSAVWLVNFSYVTVAKSLKEAVDMVCADFGRL